MAVKLKIPLIVWGCHQGIDQVGMFSHLDEVEMTRKYRKEHDLMGFEAEDLINDFDHITEGDVAAFCYPDNRQLENVGVRGIYLNNFVRWDSRAQHEQMIELYDYETAQQTRTFDTYNDVDCWNYSDTHDFIKYLKHGYGTVTDHVCREIRLKKMSRKRGAQLIQKYQTRNPENLGLFLSWLGITENAFNYVIDQHRNPSYWLRGDDWVWRRTNYGVSPLVNSTLQDCALESSYQEFLLTEEKCSRDSNDEYILIGKGL